MASGEWDKFVDGDDVVDFRTLAPEDFEQVQTLSTMTLLSSRRSKSAMKKLPMHSQKNRTLWIKKLRTIPKAMFFAQERSFSLLPKKTHYGLLFEDFWINYNICRERRQNTSQESGALRLTDNMMGILMGTASWDKRQKSC